MRAPRPTSNRHLSEIGGAGRASKSPLVAFVGPGREDYFTVGGYSYGTVIRGSLMLDDNSARNGNAEVTGIEWSMGVPDIISPYRNTKSEYLRDAGLALLPEDTPLTFSGTMVTTTPAVSRTGVVLTLTPVSPSVEIVESSGSSAVSGNHGKWFKLSFDEGTCLWVDGKFYPRFASESIIEEYGGPVNV